MSAVRTYALELGDLLKSKLRDYTLLVKLRLSFTVVFSSLIAYAVGLQGTMDYGQLALLFLGGFFITGGANAINEVLEKDLDKLMNRTKERPLAANRMGVTEAILAAGIMGIAGISILWYFFNPSAALLGALSLFLYSFIYTPLKRVSPIAVFVGAIPGAMPPLIGWVAATGSIAPVGMAITALQFLWQFPHFWSIGWISQDDYLKAGFRLLPSEEGRGKFTAFQAIAYIMFMIPVSVMPYLFGVTNGVAAVVMVLAGLVFLAQAIQLFRTCEMKDAKRLMFGSIIYLPVVLIALLMGKI
ncbi:MAG: heme o synthase [Chitinophagales bacterium]|nr:heme o synthase [Chitinophagales bacterium]